MVLTSAMLRWVAVLVAVLVVSAQNDENKDIRMPASIVMGPPKEHTFRVGEKVTLTCLGAGTPKPSYEWKRNGLLLDKNLANIDWHEGNITITAGPLDEGYYQCFTTNQYGTAMSAKTHMRWANLGSYPPSADILEYHTSLGEPLKLTCEALKCVPKATYTWVVTKNAVETSAGTPVQLTNRIQVDEDGHLLFANIQPQDTRNGDLYKCNVYNPVLSFTAGGSFSRIVFKEGMDPNPPGRGPTINHSTKSPAIALRGKTFELRCIYAGNPTPTVSWKRVGGSLPFGRYEKLNSDTTLRIMNVEIGDQGEYECVGNNGVGNIATTIDLVVQAEPEFSSPDPAINPVNTNVTIGEMAEFNCIADAIGKNEPVVEWFINGKKLDKRDPGPRRSISNDGNTLYISNACKDCKDEGPEATDLMSLACNSSNEHGYAFKSAYLNVLVPTGITKFPEDHQLDWKETVRFECEATSDDSTPVMIDWEYNDRPIIYLPDRIEMEEGTNTLLITTGNEDDSGKNREGNYSCVATNGYSTRRAYAVLSLPPTEAPIKGASLADMWWIFLIIALILLLIILCCCCCLCMRRNKGDKYPVDEKERANGNNPEKELEETGWHDYQRPEDAPIKGSRASLTSTIKLDSDDEGSLNEYGDIDTGKFNEDGSFIGQYIEKDKKRPKDSVV